MSSISVGVVVQLEETEGGYYKLVIRIQIPFDFKFLRFYIWNIKRLNINDEMLMVGENVKISYEKGKFLKLKSIERVSLDLCEICGAYSERNGVPIACDQCSDISKDCIKKRIDSDLKLIAKTEKQYTYSLGRRLTFVDKDNENYYFTIVYENEPMYPITDGLQLKKIYSVKGWEMCGSDDGYVIKVMDINQPNRRFE